jgi:hypothetical protein
MKVAYAFLVVALLAAAATPLSAQPTTRMSWNECPVVVPELDVLEPFVGPYRVVLSATNLPAVPISGYVTEISVYPRWGVLPDCWRFDESGCQTGSRITYSSSAFNLDCPSLEHGTAHGTQMYTVNPDATSATIHLENTFDAFTPDPLTRYTLYVVSFDMSNATLWGSAPGSGKCGWAAMCVTLADVGTQFVAAGSGNVYPAINVGREHMVEWGDYLVCFEVPTEPSTWGSVKALYR